MQTVAVICFFLAILLIYILLIMINVSTNRKFAEIENLIIRGEISMDKELVKVKKNLEAFKKELTEVVKKLKEKIERSNEKKIAENIKTVDDLKKSLNGFGGEVAIEVVMCNSRVAGFDLLVQNGKLIISTDLNTI